MSAQPKWHIKIASYIEKAICGTRKNPNLWLVPDANWTKVKALFTQNALCRNCLQRVASSHQGIVRTAYAKEAQQLLRN